MATAIAGLAAAAALAAQAPGVGLPAESAGLDQIVRTLISSFDRADVLALGEAHASQPDSALRIALVRHPEFANGESGSSRFYVEKRERRAARAGAATCPATSQQRSPARCATMCESSPRRQLHSPSRPPSGLAVLFVSETTVRSAARRYRSSL